MKEPIWIVNDLGELGVKIGDRCFFLYKGECIEYLEGNDDGQPVFFRCVGKREFGETCHPFDWWDKKRYKQKKYTRTLHNNPVNEALGIKHRDPLSHWQPIPDQPPEEQNV